jgi:hypothetical protein
MNGTHGAIPLAACSLAGRRARAFLALEGRDLGRRHPALGAVGNRVGHADDGQPLARAGHRDLVAGDKLQALVALVPHDLSRAGDPVALGQGQVVDRAAR